MKEAPTKTAMIRQLLKKGMAKDKIAAKLGCDLKYVRVIASTEKTPTYKRDWMRRKRAEDAAYREKEKQWQLAYNDTRREKRYEP